MTLVLLSHIAVFGYGSGKINKVWLEHNVIKNGENGMVIHADINVSGVKGNKIKAIAYFYDSNKNKLEGNTSGYLTSNNQVCASDVSTSTYEDSHWKDFDIFIPLRAIPLKPGSHTYYILLDIRDVTQGIWLTDNRNYVSFTGTGNSYNKNDDNYDYGSLESRIVLPSNENNAGNITTKNFYYECMMGFQGNIIAGDGTTSITVYYSSGKPYKVKCGNQIFELSYAGLDNGWKIYGTQYKARKFGFNDYYVADIAGASSTTFYNPKKGVVSGNPSSAFNGNMFGGSSNSGSSSGGYNSSAKTCSSCHGSGRCTMCSGDGYYWLQTGGYIGADIRRKQTCSGCGGSGNCRTCYGKGKIY